MQGFLAYVLPVSGGEPSHPIAPGGPPPGVQPPMFPTHPIAPGGGGGNGGVGIWPSPGHPAHPIAPGGGGGTGIWGPGSPMPTPPIYVPITPPGGQIEHPIYIPVYPSQLPTLPPELSEAVREALKAFAQGNLPPTAQPTEGQQQ